MTVPVFFLARLLGVEDFLTSPASSQLDRFRQERLFLGRARYAGLLMDVLPRGLLQELGLSTELLGTSSGSQFLLVIPQENVERALGVLREAAAQVAALSQNRLRLVWALTEHLGDWTTVRRRLDEQLQEHRLPVDESTFLPFRRQPEPGDDEYFIETWGGAWRDVNAINWSAQQPARPDLGEGGHAIPLSGEQPLILAKHIALDDRGDLPAGTVLLARRAQGRKLWGVLRGDVDEFAARLRRTMTGEDQVTLSRTIKLFLAVELDLQASMPEYFRKVTVLRTGGDDFAVLGAWDALIALAQELHRLFERFIQANWKELAGMEGKTLSMALALPGSPDDSISDVYAAAGRDLRVTKSLARDSFFLLGRSVEWRHFAEAITLKDSMVRLVRDFRASPALFHELGSFYREPLGPARRRSERLDRPWRFRRRLNLALGSTVARGRELEKQRQSLMRELLGTQAGQVRLRPAGRVAIEWANLTIDRSN